MVTTADLRIFVLVPVLLAGVVALIGWWRRWRWAMPLAVGAGFLAGIAGRQVPELPPQDGSDWIFWLAVPVTALGCVDAVLNRRWKLGWLLAAAAGPVAYVLLCPLIPHATSWAHAVAAAIGLAATGVGLVWMLRFAEERVGPAAVAGGLCIALGGAAVVVLSSNFRTVGLYGMGAAAALVPVVLATTRFNADQRLGQSLAVVCVPLLIGILVAGRYYPEPGVTWTNFIVLLASPGLLLVGVAVPSNKIWPRAVAAVAAVVAVALAVAAVTIPTALHAKKAAETDPYAAYSY